MRTFTCRSTFLYAIGSGLPLPLSVLIIASSLCVTPSGLKSLCLPAFCLFLICLSAFICLFNSSACSIHLPVPFICLFNSSACSIHLAVPFICLFNSSACSIHLPVPFICLFNSSACYIHLPVQFICLFHSSACSIHLPVPFRWFSSLLPVPAIWHSFHLPIHSSPCPFICLSFHLLVQCSFICLSVPLCGIHLYVHSVVHCTVCTLAPLYILTREKKLPPPSPSQSGQR